MPWRAVMILPNLAELLLMSSDADDEVTPNPNIASLVPPVVNVQHFVDRVVDMLKRKQKDAPWTIVDHEDNRKWTVKVTDNGTSTTDLLPRATLMRPTPGFWEEAVLAGTDAGSSVQRLSIGRYVDEWGQAHFPVVAKEIKGGWTNRTLGVTRGEGLTYRNGPHVDVKANLEQFVARVGDHRNVVRILGVEDFVNVEGLEAVENARIFTPWYAGGTLADKGLFDRYGERGTLHILMGAFTGLELLNEQLGLLHLDIKPSNIFIDVDVHGLPVGVVGDIDEMLQRDACDPQLHHGIIRTPCYGSPFEHCDPRRDQAAMVLVALQALTGVSWWASCQKGIQQKVNEVRGNSMWIDENTNERASDEVIEAYYNENYGFLGVTPGMESDGWFSDATLHYFEAISEQEVQGRVPPEIWTRFQALMDDMSTQPDLMVKLDRTWKQYGEAHQDIVRSLR